ncbi:hypothetical protein, partial [Ralstonia pseudosolanacearum]
PHQSQLAIKHSEPTILKRIIRRITQIKSTAKLSKKKGNKPPHHKSEAPIRQWTLRNRNIIPPTCWPALLQQTAFLK